MDGRSSSRRVIRRRRVSETKWGLSSSRRAEVVSPGPPLAGGRRAAWYDKRLPTFAGAIALGHKESWAQATFRGSHLEADIVKVPRVFMERLTDALCYAA
jgi:hypothetical protein